MSKKNDYSKVFGGGKTNYDFKVKKKKSKSHDIFFNETSKKKKKKKNKPDKIDKIVKRAVGANDDDGLSEFLVWEKIEDSNIKTFKDLSEQARGVFIVEILLHENTKGLVPVMITENGDILHTETGEKIEIAIAKYSTGSEELSEVDLATTEDALKHAEIIETIYNIDTGKIMNSINFFNNVDVDDF